MVLYNIQILNKPNKGILHCNFIFIFFILSETKNI
jgi:hypothetical protein